MSEFGHIGFQGNDLFIDVWGTGDFLITAENGQVFRFEDSDRFGPALVKKNGELRQSPHPLERSPFWRAHRIWVRQGRRVEDDGQTCIWDEPEPMKVKRVSKKHALVIENGEEDGKIIYDVA